MSVGALIVNSNGQVIMDAQSKVPLLVARAGLPYLAYTWGNPFEPSPAPVPVPGCTPSTHFAVLLDGNYIATVENGQVSWVASGKGAMFTPTNDVMLVFKYQ